MKTAARWGLAAYLVLRIIASVAAWYSDASVTPDSVVGVPGYEAPMLGGAAGTLFGVWLRADALWYLKISTQGYGPEVGTFAFFPLFPLFVAIVRPLFGGGELYAALFVANAFAAGGLILFFLLARQILDDAGARAATFGLALFPTSFFLVAPYAESLLLAFGSASLLFALRGKRGAAAVAGGLAALTRPFGALLFLPLTWISLKRSPPGKSKLAAVLPAIAPLVTLGGWLVFTAFQTGEPWLAFRVQSLWQREPSVFLVTLIESAIAWWELRATSFGPYLFFDLLVVVAFLGMIFFTHLVVGRDKSLRESRWGFTAYPLAILFVALSFRFGPRPLLSVPRFVLAGFTAFLGLGILPAWTRIPLALLSGGAMAVAAALYVGARPIF